jgi:hypothetical protein
MDMGQFGTLAHAFDAQFSPTLGDVLAHQLPPCLGIHVPHLGCGIVRTQRPSRTSNYAVTEV